MFQPGFHYKLIIEIDPSKETELMSHVRFGVTIRKAHGGWINEFVIETHDPLERNTVNKIVDLFDISGGY